MSSTKNEPGRYEVTAVANALRVLSTFGEFGAVSVGQAAEAANVSPSTAYRLLLTLEAQGYVQRIGKRGYRLGPASIRLARQMETQVDLHVASEDLAQELVSLTGLTVRMAVLADGALLVTYSLEGPHEVLAESRNDVTVEVNSSAMGKAVAAHLEPGRLARLLGEEPYPRYTQRTLTTWRQLQPLLERVRQTGYSTDLEESSDNVRCVASPIFRGDAIVGAISLEGSSDRMDDAQLPRLANLVKQAAERITHRLTPIRLQDMDQQYAI